MPRKNARWLRLLLCTALAVPFADAPVGMRSLPFAVNVALADDDDGGGGGGSRSSSASSGSGARGGDGRQLRRLRLPNFGFFQRQSRAKRQARPRRVVRAAPIAAVPVRVSGELIALGLDEGSIQALVAEGFAVAERRPLALTASELVRLRIPSGIGLETARDRVRGQAAGATVDFNHYYEPEQAGGSASASAACGDTGCALVRHLVGWSPATAGSACAAPVRIGLIDTAINRDHASLSGARLDVLRLETDNSAPSGAQHGTAVAALLVGAADSRAPGLLPQAELVAVDAFRQVGAGAELASAHDLVRALDELARRDVRVVNLSLAGPHNDLLETVVGTMTAKLQTVLVAAVGNAGSNAPPQFPAAYDAVIAVTAVDGRRNPYRRAIRGSHVDLAAPGVNVWTAASIAGARPKSGTSFAAPFVTAAAALLLSTRPDLTAAGVADALSRGAQDIGKPGKDAVFGWGLLNARGLCGDDAAVTR